MMEYNFDLAGLGVTLKTPEPIQISQNLQPFVSAVPKTADCTITIRYAALPQPGKAGTWHGPQYYETAENCRRIFHCKGVASVPMAVTEFGKDQHIQITVHPDYPGYFSGTSGVLHHIGFENLLLQHKGLLLHASLIKYAQKGIAFTGPSGVGKSTQAALWESAYGAAILNGDRAALRKTESGWVAYGAPFAGTSGIYKNESAPLSAVVVLRQAEQNHLRRLTGREALLALWPEISACRWDERFVEDTTSLCAELLTDIPVYELECLPDISAAACLMEGLSL